MAHRGFTGHPADASSTESVALIIQLADPAGLDWITHPKHAKAIQHVVLEQMARKSFVAQARAEQSLRQFWQDYPYSRPARPPRRVRALPRARRAAQAIPS